MNAKHVVLGMAILTAAAGQAADSDWKAALTKEAYGKEREWKLTFSNWGAGGRSDRENTPLSVKVAAVHSTDQGVLKAFSNASGELTGLAIVAPAASIPAKATIEIRMHGALVGGAPAFGERCLVVQLVFDGDRVVSVTHGALSKKDDVYNVVTADPNRVALTRSPGGIKGRVEIETETLDMTQVVYGIEIDARAMGRAMVGVYKLTADIAGAGKATVDGNFDGNWSEGATARTVDPRPWYSAVAGFVPVNPTEHPRLLFRKSDVQGLRKKAETPEGKAILARLRKTLNGGDGETMPGHFSKADKAYDNEGGKPSSGLLHYFARGRLRVSLPDHG